MKESEYIKIITDQGHLPPLKDAEMPRATKKKLRSHQQLRLDELREEQRNSTEKLKVKIISTYLVKNDIFEKQIEQLNFDADKIVDIVSVRDAFYIWYKE